jgi:TatA/E family protein of Tat protein translocase
MVGHTEIIIVAGVVLVLFGSAAIPKFFRSLGKARKEFEKGAAEPAAQDDTADEQNVSKKSK